MYAREKPAAKPKASSSSSRNRRGVSKKKQEVGLQTSVLEKQVLLLQKGNLLLERQKLYLEIRKLKSGKANKSTQTDIVRQWQGKQQAAEPLPLLLDLSTDYQQQQFDQQCEYYYSYAMIQD